MKCPHSAGEKEGRVTTIVCPSQTAESGMGLDAYPISRVDDLIDKLEFQRLVDHVTELEDHHSYPLLN